MKYGEDKIWKRNRRSSYHERDSKPDYKKDLRKELGEIKSSEIWEFGKIVRDLRPKN
jgi:hypothetical protein